MLNSLHHCMLENHDASKMLPWHPAGWATLPEYCKKHIGPLGRKSTHGNRVRVSLYKSVWKKRCLCIFKRTLRRKCLLLAKACLLQCFSSKSARLVQGAHCRLLKHTNYCSVHCGNTNIILTSQVLTFSFFTPFLSLSFFSCASILFIFYVLKSRKIKTTDLKDRGGKGKKKSPNRFNVKCSEILSVMKIPV